MIGTQVQQFKILAKLGQGGMGEVFVAEDTNLDRKVALKFLPPHYSASADFKARFEHEAKAAASLNHPNIITIHHFGEHEGRLFIAMELVEGQTLAALINSDALTVEKAIDVALQMSEALSAAHEKGIVHRDVKPANILIDSSGRMKILDFGLAKSARATLDTQSGTTMGTVQYESPEQSRGDKVDVRSDLFSLGVVLYEMISGQLPFKGEFEDAIRYAIAHEEPEPLARYKSGVPDDLQHIVAKLLEKDPSLRYQTAAGVTADLKRLQRSSDPQLSAVGQPTYRQEPEKRRWLPFLLPASLAIVAVVVLLVFKPWSIDVQPTQEAVAGEDRLAVMYFDNLIDREDPQRLGEIVTNLLITAMSTSEHVRVVSSQRLYDILKRLGREGERTVDRDVATQVAHEADAKWMLLGNIVQVEPEMVVTAQLVEVASGNVLASQRIVGKQDERVFALVDRLTDGLRKDLAIPEAPGDVGDRGSEELTTGSMEAYRHYLEGVEYANKFMTIEARKSFREAIRLDSTFAVAYHHLSLALGNGPDAIAAEEQAFKYIDHANDLQQRYIRGRLMGLRGENTTAHLEAITRDYPDEKFAWMALSTLYEAYGKFEKSVEAAFKVLEIDPLYKLAYNKLAYTYDHLGEHEKSIWAINKYIELAPTEPNPYDSRADLYAASGHVDEAIASYRMALEVEPRFVASTRKLAYLYLHTGDIQSADSIMRTLLSNADPGVRAGARVGMTLIEAYQGRLQEARRLLDAALEMIRLEMGEGDVYGNLVTLRGFYEYLSGDYAKAVGSLNRGLEIQRDAGVAQWYIDRDRGYVATAFAGMGERDSAAAIVAAMKKNIGNHNAERDPAFWGALASAELCLNMYDTAAAHAEHSVRLVPNFMSELLLGRCYLGAGRLGDAVTTLERAIGIYDDSRTRYMAMSVLVHYWLGQAYEQSGWSDKAAEQYTTFLDIWKDADPGIQEVADAQKRLAALRT